MQDDLKKLQKMFQRAERKQKAAADALAELHEFAHRLAEKHEGLLGVSIQSVIPKDPD